MAKKRKNPNVTRRDFLTTGVAAGVGTTALVGLGIENVEAAAPKWHKTYDVVVVGAGGSGLRASIRARDLGNTVAIVEENHDIGGHAICSGANIPLGGGTSIQKKAGIEDSPDLVYRDLTDWSLTEPNGVADYRYNDREVIRAFADNCAQTFEFLLEHGVTFGNEKPDGRAGSSHGNSAARQMHVWAGDWPQVQTGQPTPQEVRATTSNGNG